jgi:hypothetical protein
MNLTTAKGHREVFSWAEVSEAIGMSRKRVEWLVASGRLTKRFQGFYPFAQSDVNSFIVALNAGKVRLGVRNTVSKQTSVSKRANPLPTEGDKAARSGRALSAQNISVGPHAR